MIKLLIGGSPCTHWSIAQKHNRETEPAGLGWELFKNYLIAMEKFKPDFFLYENNKSASPAIKNEISKRLGVDLMYINSSLVSAQNRQRFYAFNWAVEQPSDRGIVLRDILENGTDLMRREKSYCLCARYNGSTPKHTIEKSMVSMVAEPIRIGTIENNLQNPAHDSKQYRVYSPDGKATTLCGQGGGVGAKTGLYAVPLNMTADNKLQCIRATCYKDGIRNLVGNTVDLRTCVAVQIGYRGRMQDGKWVKQYEAREDEKANAITTAQTDSMVAESFEYVDYSPRDKTHIVINDNAIRCAQDKNGASAAESFVQFTDVKCGTITTAHVPKAIMLATSDGKPIYEVQNGKITIKGKEYPIKLADGFYIIRKLTPIECERLQTMPDNYTAAVSNAQRYKGLGNGWTAEVIIHILNGALKNVPRDEEIVVLSMYDGIGTGRYCLDKMGFMNVRYYAYEIDKYAKKIANSNYPDIIQMGDAFDLRNPDWPIGGNTE